MNDAELLRWLLGPGDCCGCEEAPPATAPERATPFHAPLAFPRDRGYVSAAAPPALPIEPATVPDEPFVISVPSWDSPQRPGQWGGPHSPATANGVFVAPFGSGSPGITPSGVLHDGSYYKQPYLAVRHDQGGLLLEGDGRWNVTQPFGVEDQAIRIELPYDPLTGVYRLPLYDVEISVPIRDPLFPLGDANIFAEREYLSDAAYQGFDGQVRSAGDLVMGTEQGLGLVFSVKRILVGSPAAPAVDVPQGTLYLDSEIIDPDSLELDSVYRAVRVTQRAMNAPDVILNGVPHITAEVRDLVVARVSFRYTTSYQGGAGPQLADWGLISHTRDTQTYDHLPDDPERGIYTVETGRVTRWVPVAGIHPVKPGQLIPAAQWNPTFTDAHSLESFVAFGGDVETLFSRNPQGLTAYSPADTEIEVHWLTEEELGGPISASKIYTAAWTGLVGAVIPAFVSPDRQVIEESGELLAYGHSFAVGQGRGTWAACRDWDGGVVVVHESGDTVSAVRPGGKQTCTRAEFERLVLRCEPGAFQAFSPLGRAVHYWPPAWSLADCTAQVRAVTGHDAWRDATQRLPAGMTAPDPAEHYWPQRPRRRPGATLGSEPRPPLDLTLADVLSRTTEDDAWPKARGPALRPASVETLQAGNWVSSPAALRALDKRYWAPEAGWPEEMDDRTRTGLPLRVSFDVPVAPPGKSAVADAWLILRGKLTGPLSIGGLPIPLSPLGHNARERGYHPYVLPLGPLDSSQRRVTLELAGQGTLSRCLLVVRYGQPADGGGVPT